jgi:hypothetical protein
MSEVGQSRRFCGVRGMSGLPPIATELLHWAPDAQSTRGL